MFSQQVPFSAASTLELTADCYFEVWSTNVCAAFLFSLIRSAYILLLVVDQLQFRLALSLDGRWGPPFSLGSDVVVPFLIGNEDCRIHDVMKFVIVWCLMLDALVLWPYLIFLPFLPEDSVKPSSSFFLHFPQSRSCPGNSEGLCRFPRPPPLNRMISK